MERPDNEYDLNALSVNIDDAVKCEAAADCVELVADGYADV